MGRIAVVLNHWGDDMRGFQGAMIGFSLLFAATSAHALESLVRKSSTRSVVVVWRKIGNFCGIGSWGPGIAKCELSMNKRRRTLLLKDGGIAVEELVAWSDAHHSYTYRIVSSPLPVVNYESTIQVIANKLGTGSVIIWRGKYDAKKGVGDSEAKKIIDSIYESGLQALTGS